MSDPQLQIQCPGCSKTLRVPGSMQGKVVTCPSCQMKLQLAAPASPAPVAPPAPAPLSPPPASAPPMPNVQLPGTVQSPTPQQAAPIAAPPSLTSNAAGPPPVQPNALDPLGPSGNVGTPAWGATAPMQQPTQTRKVRRKRVEEEPEESFLGNLGYYLIATAVLASIAPLFGLEHKALRHAGEFGPIIGIILGLVGSGLIASRGNSQSFVIAGVCAVLCVGAGIFGYQLKRAEGQPEMGGGFAQMTAAEKEAARKEELEQLKNPAKFRPASPPNSSSGFQQPNIPGFNPGNANNNSPTIPGFDPGRSRNPTNSIPGGGSNPASELAEEMAKESERFREESRKFFEESQRQAEEIRQEHMNRMKDRMNGNPAANRPGRPFGSPPFGGRGGRGGRDVSGRNPGFRGPPNNSGSGIPSTDPATAGSRFDFTKRFNSGLNVMQFRTRGNQDLSSNYRFEKIAGGEASFGKIFFSPSPIKAVDFAVFDDRVFILPAEPDEESENQFRVPDGKALVGLNLAVINGNLAGVQGIFGDPDPKRKGRYDLTQTTTSKWLGKESEVLLIAMTKGKPAVGMVVFKNLQDITGIQLITSKQSSQ